MKKNVAQTKNGTKINSDVNLEVLRNIVYVKKVIVGILVHVLVKMAVICVKVTETTKGNSTKNILAKSTPTNFFFLLTFFIVNAAVLIAVSIYCYFKKYQSKRKDLLPCHYTIAN